MKYQTLTRYLLVGAISFSLVQAANAGKLRRLVYWNYNGSNVTNLFGLNNSGIQAFPDSPDVADFLPNTLPNPPFNAETALNAYDNYGSWIRGYLTAPETGNYTFWLASDDEGQFFMTTDPTDPLNPAKTNLICWVPGYSGNREWTKFPTQQSAPIALEAGKTYYVEVLHKDGTSSDHIVLGWQTPSGALERPMPSWYFQPIRDTRWGELDVEVIVGPAVMKDATDSSVYDGMRAVAFANVNLAQPVTYQWFKNGAPIPDATNCYYLFRAQVADNNSQWTVQANSGGTIYAPAAPTFLYVTTDKPAVLSAGPVPHNPTQIQVLFSEDVTPNTATNTFNYTLTGGSVQSATLGADGRTVTLYTSLLLPTQPYTLTIRNVQDMAVPPNTMDPASVTFVLAEGSATFRVWYTPLGTSLANLRAATTNGTSNAAYTNNLFNEEFLVTTNSYGWNIVPLRNAYSAEIIGYLTAPETGIYKFAIASDDDGILYLGTSDQRSSKREIATVSGSTGRWALGKYTSQVSGNISLEAGKQYFFEAVYRDGTGGDGITVAWQTPSMTGAGQTLPLSSSGVQADTQPFIIPAQYMSPLATYGPLTIKKDLPATLTVPESALTNLSVVVDGLLPYSYQWFRNGTLIPGAGASSYTLPFPRPADNNATFQVVINNNFSSVTSAVTTLVVIGDTTKPAVASVGSLFKQKIDVRFTEPVTAATAGDTASYILLDSAGAAVGVNSVVLDGSDATHVTLQTAPLPETDLMRLAVQNVADQSGAANVITTVTNMFRALNFDAVESINNIQAWSASAVDDQIQMTAGGNDIWGASDEFVYLYKTVTGPFDYKVKGVSLPAVNSWCKMGIMGRVSTSPGSRNVFNPFTPVTPGQNTYSAQVRDTTGGNSTSSNDGGSPLNVNVQTGVAARPTILPYPSWVRIQRIGNNFYYYYGADGTNWTFWTYYDSSVSAEGALPNTMLLGLALTSHDRTRTVDGVMASFIAVNDGALRFDLQPTNTTVVEGQNAVFAVKAAGGTPYFYQWRTNNVDFTDATNATLTLTRVPFSLNGMQFSCRISNLYGESVTSTNGILAVIQDTNAPTVRYYVLPKINLNPTVVKLVYSEPMDATSAQKTSNYQITTSPGGTPLAISAAVLDTDERTVTLTTAAQTAGTLYKVIVNNVFDQACCPPNAVAANSTDYFYYAGSPSGNFAQRSDGYIIMEAENAQLNEAGSSGGAVPFSRLNTKLGFSGLGYMVVPNGSGTGGTGGTSPNLYGTGAKLTFNVLFNRTGRHIVWIRGWNQDSTSSTTAGNDDSVFVGFSDDGVNDWLVAMSGTADNSACASFAYTGWSWRSDRYTGTDPLTFTNTTTGLHKFIIWQREDGTLVDKIVIEAGNRSPSSNTAAPAPATSYDGMGDPESWDWQVPPPAPPTVSISNPANGQIFAAGGNITIETTPAGPSPIGLVEFFSGGVLIGSTSVAPYSFTWQNVPDGIYSLTARVTDVLGYQATSAAVGITVDSTKPVAYAVGSLRGTGIGVYFTDLSGLDPVTATNPVHYLVNNGAVVVTNATLEPDNQTVMLALNAPITGAFSVQVTNVADRGFGPNVMDNTTLQSAVVTGFLDQDVGTPDTNNPALFTDPIMAGLAQAIDTDGFYVRAGGHDIWDAADGMHFVYVPVTGSFDVAVRVAGLLRPDVWSKAGLSVRADLEGNSRNFFLGTAPTNGQNVITLQARRTKGATSQSEFANRPTPTPIPNCWLRMTRTNDVFTFYWGTNGTAWTMFISTNIALVDGAYPATAYVGLATTSHNNGTNVSNITAGYYRNLTGLIQTIPTPPSPVLTAQISGANLAIAWTSSSPNFQLQSCPALPAGGWQDVTAPRSTNGNTYTVTVPMGETQQFFRLLYKP